MGLFSKKKKNDFFQITDEAENSPFTQKSDGGVSPSHMLTADEIISNFADGSPSHEVIPHKNGVSPLESMRKRMLDNVAAENQRRTGDKPQAVPDETKHQPKEEPATVSPAGTGKQSTIDFMSLFEEPEEKPDISEQPQAQPRASDTLLNRCMPYIVDDEGHNVTESSEPIYRLQSVADILRTNSERTLEELSRKYDMTFDDLGRGRIPPAQPQEMEEPKVKEEITAEKSIPDEALPIVTEEDEVLIFDEELPQISDIDTKTTPKILNEEPLSQTATIRFTPVRDGGSDTDHISVSTITRAVDLTGEFGELSLEQETETEETQLEESEFESFEAEDDLNDEKSAKRLMRRFAVGKRRAFLQSIATGLLLCVMLIFLLPSLSSFLIATARTAMTVCTCLLTAAALINFDMFASVKNVFSKRATTDSAAMLSTVINIALGITAAAARENVFEILLVGMIILFVRAVSRFQNTSGTLGNLRQAMSNRPKKAVTLLTDEATTFAMSKSAIEGDALIAAPRTADSLDDFMKYSEYAPVLDGRMRIVNIASAALALIMALASAAIFANAVSAVYSAAVIMSIAAAPILFTLDSMPLYSAASRLNKKGAFIAGIAAANRLEMANAAVLSSSDIFPDGTVTMHDMKVLSENNFDETILRAASLTEAVGSPLATIFKKIAGTNSDYTIPDSDTVKYEDKLGLSGWVDDELLFIGNRTLMQAHGIQVPDVEVDRKILRRGFFPVYLASGGKACALIVVQYNVDPQVVSELRRLTNLGVTLLINNCDPNLTEEMICDYIGLYGDSVKIMSNSGVHMYKNAVIPCGHCSAPAAFRGNPLNFISVLNCASRIKSSTKWLTVFYYLAICFGVILFAYLSFLGGAAAPVGGMQILLTHLAAIVVSYIIFLFRKP